MPLPTIEQFIESNKKNCINNAKFSIRRKYLSETGESRISFEALFEMPEAAAALEKALASNSFYKALSSEDAVNDPAVISAYEKYTESCRISAERNRQTKKALSYKSLREAYLSYTFSQEETDEFVSEISKLVTAYFSDLKMLIPSRMINDIYSGTVTESTYSQFRRAVENASKLSRDKIDTIIKKSRLPYMTVSEWLRCASVENLLEQTPFTKKQKKEARRKLKDETTLPHPQAQQIYERIFEAFDRKTALNLIAEKSDYRSISSFMERELMKGEHAKELILKEIPENVIDLYPAARTINRHFVLHLGPTNSGKTYMALEACKKARSGVYLGPLRLLAYEVCEKFNIQGVPCSMVTGEESIDVPFSEHTASTVEMLNPSHYYEVGVIDECQLIEDEERGGAWTAAILGLMASEIHLCASPSAENILLTLIEMCGDSYEVINHERQIPLIPDKQRFVFPGSVQKNDALIVFSKRSVLEYAGKLAAAGINASVIYGDLPYDVRRNEVNRFVSGQTDVVVATDAIGMGLNLPIKRIVFLETFKFDGHEKRFLKESEIKQIAGRAGRMGIFDLGLYTSAADTDRIIKRYKAYSRDIDTARLRFPETALSVDMPLSEILLRWSTIPDNDIFLKNTVAREIMLSRELEKKTSDKTLIYRFVTIPFNEAKKELYDFWMILFDSALSGKEDHVSDFMMLISYDENELEELEIAYKKCDILYFYLSRVADKEDTEEVMELKRRISRAIMKLLSESEQTENVSAV